MKRWPQTFDGRSLSPGCIAYTNTMNAYHAELRNFMPTEAKQVKTDRVVAAAREVLRAAGQERISDGGLFAYTLRALEARIHVLDEPEPRYRVDKDEHGYNVEYSDGVKGYTVAQHMSGTDAHVYADFLNSHPSR